jgi:hypothetical protein
MRQPTLESHFYQILRNASLNRFAYGIPALVIGAFLLGIVAHGLLNAPVMLHMAAEPAIMFAIAIGTAGLLLAVSGLATIVRALRACGPEGVLMSASALAHYGTLGEIAAAIEADQAGGVRAFGPVQISGEWIVALHRARFDVIRIPDIALITRRKAGRRAWLDVCDRHGTCIGLPVGPLVIDLLGESLHARVPWAVYETSPAAVQDYQNDLPGFVAWVDERRARYLREHVGDPSRINEVLTPV